jgi:hypothetical protein
MFSHTARMAGHVSMSQFEREYFLGQLQKRPAEAPKPNFLVGLSVGQGGQPSGVAILEKSKAPPQPASYTCRYLRRWLPPDTAYPKIMSALANMLLDARLGKCDLIVEAGQSISAVLGMLKKKGLHAAIRGVEVKASGAEGLSDGIWKVTKGSLIETARLVLQEHRLTFDSRMPPEVAATTPPVQIIYQAMLSYPYNKTPPANEAFASRDGEHDDLVLPVALACWFGERRKPIVGALFLH